MLSFEYEKWVISGWSIESGAFLSSCPGWIDCSRIVVFSFSIMPYIVVEYTRGLMAGFQPPVSFAGADGNRQQMKREAVWKKN